jgi:uncharacterized protein (TIGR00661 family)
MTRIDQSFDADVCVSDFESLAYLYGQRHGLPVISIDNMQIINRCTLEVDIPDDEKVNFYVAKGIVKAKLPGCYHYLITTFFHPPVRKDRTSLHPPLLRDEILAAKTGAVRGEHVLVYQTSDSYSELIPTLRSLPGRFVVYGLKRNESLGNVQLKEFSEAGFVDDLASSRAVITGGGFSLMTESIYLGKPVLSVPIKQQFEQLLNALYLEKLGYGEYVPELSKERIERFLGRADEYAGRVAQHVQDGNQQILSALDGLIDRIAAAKRS